MEQLTEQERRLWIEMFGKPPKIECSPVSEDGKTVTVTITKECYMTTSKLLALNKLMEGNKN